MNLFLSEFNIRAWRLIKHYELEKAADVTLIYGKKGLGKTSILRYLHEHRGQHERGILADALAFAHQYAYAAQDNKLNSFRQRYRRTRLLLIDDLQVLEGKVKTIEELHYTYEYVIENGGKMVITLEGDTPNLEFLGKRLASRFLSGVAVPIAVPLDNELERFMVEYIQQKHLFMDQEIPGMIANLTDNLAEALKIIEQFIEFAVLQENELSLQCFQAYWETRVRKGNNATEPINIIKQVAQSMEIPVDELLGPSRKPRVNEAREMAIYAIRMLCQISYPAIACYFNRNHSTMIISHKKMQEKLTKDHRLEQIYNTIIKVFQV
ncbi:chromosomal replication initiator DnaA [Desulfosporosinus fructosivorans]|uniref:Chromosomal replication initiator DnaA n=1 Tax=Desulfosporosinus fructosivorans TaxID=2018669 RepID=A0A4Z0R1D4_9FIRM|nr:DnaA/Hda family protein [Desulfosporosinus fructosivorans]TGE36811.1 chromosomal replication initiator DnaA [Desulfosporosinus fructosivorans]